MQIVIKIDDNLYTRLFDNGVDNYDDAVDMAKAIRKGTPLPKGHGRLIDEQSIIDRFKPIEKFEHWRIGLDGLFNVLSDAPTILEADKESEK